MNFLHNFTKSMLLGLLALSILLMAASASAQQGTALKLSVGSLSDTQEMFAKIKLLSPSSLVADNDTPQVQDSAQAVSFTTIVAPRKPLGPTFTVMTRFLRHSSTIEKYLEISQGPHRDDTVHMRMALDNQGQAFKQALLNVHGMPVMIYERAQDIFAYMQSKGRGSRVELKEWIYARQPNCAEGTCLRWVMRDQDFNRRLVFDENKKGGIVIQRQMIVPGIDVWDYQKQRHIIAAVKEALKKEKIHIAGEDIIGKTEPVYYWTKEGVPKIGCLNVPVPGGGIGNQSQILEVRINEPASAYPLLIDPTLTLSTKEMDKDFQELMSHVKAVAANVTANSSSDVTVSNPNLGDASAEQAVTFTTHRHLIIVQTKFLKNSATIDESVRLSSPLGKPWLFPDLLMGDHNHSHFILDNQNEPFQQALMNDEGIPVQVYDRQGETFAYMQFPNEQGGVDIKEWIYARKPNCDEGTCFNWQVEGAMSATMMPLNYWTREGIKKQGSSTSGSDSLRIIIKEPISSYPLLIDPTMSWGQWLGGVNYDEVDALTVNGSSIYAGGFSQQSTGWNNEGVTFNGVFNGGATAEGFVVKVTDGGVTPTASWGQWLGGTTGYNEVLTLAVNGSSVYAGGSSQISTGWNNQGVTLQGVFNAGSGNYQAFVVKITDSGTTPSPQWGQWLGGTASNSLSSVVVNGSSIYAAGYAEISTGWNSQGVTFNGIYNAGAGGQGFVVKITDGATPSPQWGQWLGGTTGFTDAVVLGVNGSSIYAGGYSPISTGWNNQGVTFQGTFTAAATYQGFVVKITDSGTTPSPQWGHWLGGGYDIVDALTVNGTSIYAGGYDHKSTGWNSQVTTFKGAFNAGATNQGFVVKITDNGTTSSGVWGQWLGGTKYDIVEALATNGSSIYAGGISQQSTGWNNQSVTFRGIFNGAAPSQGFVAKMNDNGTIPIMQWGQWQGGTKISNILAMTINGGSIYAGGQSHLSTGWNNENVTFQGVNNATQYSGFVTKMADDSNAIWNDGMGF